MPAISPRTQQFQAQQGAGVDQANALFEQGFSQMAYNVLVSKHPDLMDSVVTFRVIDADVDAGKGVGAFVLQRDGRPVYIPVVLADNQIKPLDLMYDKGLNIFLPLSRDWLDELDKISLESLGKGIKTPETLYSDVDIRNIVVPPLTGRFSYASYVEGIEKTAHTPEKKLLAFLAVSPNAVKVAFRNTLTKHPRLMKRAAAVYGVNALAAALQPRAEKRAATQQYGGALWIADKDTPVQSFKRIFGDRAGEAYTKIRTTGYATNDTRPGLNRAMYEQVYTQLTEPHTPGIYTLFNINGKEEPALVIPDAINVFARPQRYAPRPAYPGRTAPIPRVYPEGRPDDLEDKIYPPAKRLFAAFPDGRFIMTNHLAARYNVADGIDGGTLYQRVFGSADGTPKNGVGFFVRGRGTTMEALLPFRIKSITEGSDGARRILVEDLAGWNERMLVTDPQHRTGKVQMSRKSPIVMLPDDFKWVPLSGEKDGQRDESHFMRYPLDVNAIMTQTLRNVGVEPGEVKDASHGQFSINGRRPMAKVAALRELAVRYYLPVDDAEEILEKAASDTRVRFYAVNSATLKKAQYLLDKTAAAEDDQAMQDAAAMQQQQAAPPPAPPSPTDLAAMEMQQQIEQEIQKLQEKAQMLQALTQRTQEIATGSPVMPTVQTQAMGAPPPSVNMATGQPAQPSVMSQPGAATMPMDPMDPAMMGQQGMAPDAASMDPSMMGQDPNAEQAPQLPQGTMGPDGYNEAAVEQQINPQFLDQAASLEADDAFDAAAVANLAQTPIVRNLVAQYVPNLEKAIDNLGRIMLTMWMQEPDLKQQIGEEAYSRLEDQVRKVFSGLGAMVLNVNQIAHAIPAADSAGAPA